MIMPMNLGHRVSTMKLPHSKPLLPLLEAIVNAFQALDTTRSSRCQPVK